MCTKKPGPRCAGHTAEHAEQAAASYRAAYEDGPEVQPLASAAAQNAASTPHPARPVAAPGLPTRPARDVQVMDFIQTADGSVCPVYAVTHPRPGTTAITVKERSTGAWREFELADDEPVSVVPVG